MALIHVKFIWLLESSFDTLSWPLLFWNEIQHALRNLNHHHFRIINRTTVVTNLPIRLTMESLTQAMGCVCQSQANPAATCKRTLRCRFSWWCLGSWRTTFPTKITMQTSLEITVDKCLSPIEWNYESPSCHLYYPLEIDYYGHNEGESNRDYCNKNSAAITVYGKLINVKDPLWPWKLRSQTVVDG